MANNYEKIPKIQLQEEKIKILHVIAKINFKITGSVKRKAKLQVRLDQINAILLTL